MTCNYYYDANAIPPESQIVDQNWVAYYGGIDPSESTPEQLAEDGFYCFTFANPPVVNPNIYTVESQFVIDGTNATQEFTVVALPLSDSKATYTEAVKSKAYDILQPTDWLVVRKVENGTEIPADWNTWREDIRLESQDKITTIDNCESADELEAYVTSEAYSYWPPEPTTPAL